MFRLKFGWSGLRLGFSCLNPDQCKIQFTQAGTRLLIALLQTIEAPMLAFRTLTNRVVRTGRPPKTLAWSSRYKEDMFREDLGAGSRFRVWEFPSFGCYGSFVLF